MRLRALAHQDGPGSRFDHCQHPWRTLVWSLTCENALNSSRGESNDESPHRAFRTGQRSGEVGGFGRVDAQNKDVSGQRLAARRREEGHSLTCGNEVQGGLVRVQDVRRDGVRWEPFGR